MDAASPVTRQLKNRALRSAAAAIVAGVVAMSISCKPPVAAEKAGRKAGGDGKPTTVKDSKPFLTPVLAERVTRGEVYSSIATTGSIVPLRSRLLRTEEAGRLEFAKDWQEGDFVAKGDLVARVISESLDSEIDRGRADVQLQTESVAIGKKSMDSSIREYQTLQDLYSRGIAALKDVDTAKLSMERGINSHRQNQISLDKSKSTLKTLTDRMERLEVFAPYDGLLVARTTLDGTKPFSTTFGTETITDFENRMVSSDFAVCGIIDTSEVFLRCDVTSRDIDNVRLGQRTSATIYSNQDVVVAGEVASISRAVNQDTRAFQVDVLVKNPERLLRPGMFGRVDIITDVRPDAISIAKEYITRRNNREVVFVAEKGNDMDYYVVREVPIEIGLAGRETLEVTFGLKEGDAIVTRGIETLQDKMPVSVLFTDDPALDNTATLATPTPAPEASPAAANGS